MNKVYEYASGEDVAELEVIDVSEIVDGEPRVPYGSPSEQELSEKKKKRIEQISEEFLSIMPWVEFRVSELSEMRGQGRSYGFHFVRLEDRKRHVLIADRMNDDGVEYVDVIVNDVFGDPAMTHRECHEFFYAADPVRLVGSMTILLAESKDKALPPMANPLIRTGS